MTQVATRHGCLAPEWTATTEQSGPPKRARMPGISEIAGYKKNENFRLKVDLAQILAEETLCGCGIFDNLEWAI
jgi:hypothetical protein